MIVCISWLNVDIYVYMKNILLFLLLSVQTLVFAASGMADRFYMHREWIFPAYAYCLLFGIIILLGLFIASLVYKGRIVSITDRISNYLKMLPFLAILFTGVSLAIPLGILESVLCEILWFLAFYPILGLLGLFPIILISKSTREKMLLSPICIKWSVMVSLSAIIASLVFIILTNYHLLPGIENPYFNTTQRGVLTHPYDSLKEIWEMVPVFMVEMAFSLVLYGIGRLYKILIRKNKN